MIRASSPPAAVFAADCMPPEHSYSSREALIAGINAWASERGYAFVVSRSTKTSSSRTIVTYACDRCKKAPSRNCRNIRKTSSRSTDCTFSLYAKESLDKSEWVVRHRPPQYHQHNHAPSRVSISSPSRLPAEAIEEIAILTRAGADPRLVRNVLREKGFLAVTEAEVRNQIAESRKGSRKGILEIQH